MKYTVNIDNAMNSEYISDLIVKCDTKSMKIAFLQLIETITDVCTLHIITSTIVDTVFHDMNSISTLNIEIEIEDIEQKHKISHDNALRAEQLLIEYNVITPIGFKKIIKI